MDNDYDWFLKLTPQEQEDSLLRRARGWGKQRMFQLWLDGFFDKHPEFIEMYGRVIDRWKAAIGARDGQTK